MRQLKFPMRTTRRIVIRRRQEDVLIVRKLGKSIQGWCPECCREVPMVSPEEAALARRLSPRLVYRLVEAHDVHFVETSDGALFICLASLMAVAEAQVQ
jgi:hypothetical protein